MEVSGAVALVMLLSPTCSEGGHVCTSDVATSVTEPSPVVVVMADRNLQAGVANGWAGERSHLSQELKDRITVLVMRMQQEQQVRETLC
jgi:hypothetical protein